MRLKINDGFISIKLEIAFRKLYFCTSEQSFLLKNLVVKPAK